MRAEANTDGASQAAELNEQLSHSLMSDMDIFVASIYPCNYEYTFHTIQLSLPGPVGQPSLAPVPPLPHELAQHVLILAAHSLVVTPNGDPIDFPDRQALSSLALVSPDNYAALQQFVYLNVPHCSFHLAAKRGDLALMDWWRTRSGMLITDHHVARALYEASCAGHLHVLEHWAATYPEEHVDPRRVRVILMDATQNGHEAIVKWWVNKTGFDPNVLHKWDFIQLVHAAIMADCLPLVRYWLADKPPRAVFKRFVALPESYGATGDCSMLEWLSQTVPDFAKTLSNESPGSWSANASLKNVALGGHLAALQWFLDYCRTHSVPLDKVFTTPVLQTGMEAGQVSVLQWWVDNGLPVDTALQVDKVTCVTTLSWMVDAGWTLESSEVAVDLADSVALLDWWLAHCGADKLKYTELAVDRACEEGRMDVLEWWFRQHSTLGSLLPLKYSSQSLDLAAESGHLDVLEWWLASDLELKIHTPLALATRGNHLDVMDWLWDHELYNKGAEEELAIYEAITQRHLKALRWWEAHAWPTDADVVSRICRKLWDTDMDNILHQTDHDKYGLDWFSRNSKMVSHELDDLLETKRREWHLEQYNDYMDCSGEDDDLMYSDERIWTVCVEDEIPYLDMARSK